MYRKLICVAVSCCLLGLLTATAFAQLSGSTMRAHVPFSFTVQGRVLPAGEYEISRLDEEGSGLQIMNVDHRHQHALIETEPVRGAKHNRGELIFHRYGETYFLSEVWGSGLETGRELPTSSQEKMLRREAATASNSVQPQTVAVAIY